MKSARWRQIEDLYHRALEKEESERAVFLRDACAGDDELRHELERLLSQQVTSFLEEPALQKAMRTLPGDAGQSWIGRRIRTYEVVSLLGAGGMGEVYRARDAKLRRDVAIKVLPASVANDSHRLARFEQEARALAAFNHPHIGAIYGFEEVDARHALVLELVEGPTLDDRLKSGALELDDALRIAHQISDALEAAHEKGIIHRDLKPANIKVTTDGNVKVLDFGLAKTLAGVSDSADLSTVVIRTEDGVILGTPSYMSPEQARGQEVDKRADIWAFGCVLFQMLSGQQAFSGRTASDSIAAILGDEPEWQKLPRQTPAAVRDLLRRCLEKDSRRRLRDIGDARIEIEEALENQRQDPKQHSEEPDRAGNLWKVFAVATLLCLIAVTVLVVIPTMRSAPPATTESLTTLPIEQLTSDAGATIMPALSPDGRLLAYASNRANNRDLDIWVQQIGGGVPLRVSSSEVDESTPDFSPDGSQIIYRSEQGGGGVYLVPAFGGQPRLIAPEGRRPRFSPDGGRIAYWSGQWRGNPSALDSAVFVVSLAGGAPSRIVPQFAMARDPVWAADGKSLLILGRRDRTSPLTDALDWWWIPLDGRPPVKTGALASLGPDAEPSPDAWTLKGVIYAIRGDLWIISISREDGHALAPPQRLTATAGSASVPDVSSDGSVVFAVTNNQRVIGRVPLGQATDTEPPLRLYADNRRNTGRASETADGSMIVFEQGFPKYQEIWMKNLRTQKQQMVTRVDDPSPVYPVVSQDGARIVYTQGADDDGNGFVIETSGGVPRRICQDCGLHGFLSDNRRVLAIWNKSHVIGIIDVMNGEKVALIRDQEGQIDRPHASPNDRWIAFRKVVGTGAKTYVTALGPAESSSQAAWQEVREPTSTGRPTAWSLNSEVVYLLLDTDGFRCLWGQGIDRATGYRTGSPFPARHLHRSVPGTGGVGTSYGNSITADGFLYEDMELTGNLWRLVLH